jgi:hypothetical protein
MDVNDAKDRTASEREERVALAIQERARRLEILDREALARREAEDCGLELREEGEEETDGGELPGRQRPVDRGGLTASRWPSSL